MSLYQYNIYHILLTDGAADSPPSQLQEAVVDVISHAECVERTLIGGQINELAHLCIYDRRNATEEKAGLCSVSYMLAISQCPTIIF